jgi:hypothetical protein
MLLRDGGMRFLMSRLGLCSSNLGVGGLVLRIELGNWMEGKLQRTLVASRSCLKNQIVCVSIHEWDPDSQNHTKICPYIIGIACQSLYRGLAIL